ncbi:MAG: arsenosugar biosynthesis radical SAM protein ArsS [Thermoflavifilum sp.]|uniref:arsenosugar biosynthesis radical SAM (seleno)protein ArsS n=1 Tax=Thermoflavifilum sp. TaxID=1968839 RepID=UPI0018A69AEB|nr:arsenosugar biosynthesis radical SAM (seleno)protein ArsS [Thermoflavifilum sp.]QOR75014.1 MAG: arsenosugar biosynthesis radical SAM protein ArsS [Thermoflavifilum sp.]
MKSLHAQHHLLADTCRQLEVLDQLVPDRIPAFQDKLRDHGQWPLRATGIEILQINVGKMCNQTCKHCHVDAGPDRREVMTRETMQYCVDVVKAHHIPIVDITGGAPEMNPHFRWLVEALSPLGVHLMVRCNLTIILANKRYHDLPEFYKTHRMEVIASLPFYAADRTDRQRGEGVFAHSIEALRMLNEVGYGYPDTGLQLHLVYNPAGAFLPPSQAQLQQEYQQVLWERYGIRFNQLFVITNMPISRYLEYLLATGNYETYMQKLVQAFNPAAISGLMCRNTLSVSWDGYLYDCDFNQMLDIPVQPEERRHIHQFRADLLSHRAIRVHQHCYGCTAGAGSSCGGQIVSEA